MYILMISNFLLVTWQDLIILKNFCLHYLYMIHHLYCKQSLLQKPISLSISRAPNLHETKHLTDRHQVAIFTLNHVIFIFGFGIQSVLLAHPIRIVCEIFFRRNRCVTTKQDHTPSTIYLSMFLGFM